MEMDQTGPLRCVVSTKVQAVAAAGRKLSFRRRDHQKPPIIETLNTSPSPPDLKATSWQRHGGSWSLCANCNSGRRSRGPEHLAPGNNRGTVHPRRDLAVPESTRQRQFRYGSLRGCLPRAGLSDPRAGFVHCVCCVAGGGVAAALALVVRRRNGGA